MIEPRRSPRGQRLRTKQYAGGKATPPPNLLLILITDREPRLCLWRFLRVAATQPRQEPQGGCRCCSHDAAEPPRTPHSLNPNCHPVSYPMMHCCNIATPPGVYRKTRNITLNSSDGFATIMYHLVFFVHTISNGSQHIFIFTCVL